MARRVWRAASGRCAHGLHGDVAVQVCPGYADAAQVTRTAVLSMNILRQEPDPNDIVGLRSDT